MKGFCCLGLEFLIRYSNNILRLYLVGVVLLTDQVLLEISQHLPYLVYLDLQQCPNLTDKKLEDLVEEKPDLEIVNYYGEIIQYLEKGDEVCAEKSSSSSSTEGAAKSDEISDGFSDID